MPDKPFSISVKIFVNDGAGKYLMIKRSEDSGWNPGKWELPGGKMDKGEIMDESLKREVKEETGLEIRIKSLFDAVEDGTPDFNIVHVIMLGDVISGSLKISHEHDEYKWVAPGDLKNLPLCEYVEKLNFDTL